MKLHVTLLISFYFVINAHVVIGARKRKAGASSGSKTDEDSITYSTEKEKEVKLAALRAERVRSRDPPLSKEERKKLEGDMLELRKDLTRAVLNHGDVSHQKANALHKLGFNLFKRGKFSDMMPLAEEIVRIHETMDGVESRKTADALGNLAMIAFKNNDKKTCERAQLRALYITLKEFDHQSKEVLMCRARLMQYGLPDPDHNKGLSYQRYQKMINKEQREREKQGKGTEL